ncbi:hypothetical protein D4764_20G0005860 [Takifugu flavidus]|uniref:Uncharacterized protein n=1 Tax=Takifugu flavidus TaxID=433684 RepID=A0A5C6NGA4_9TELE|nr:hypothetical protein D4764_20G0005860 [Takifugu flavidus]
MGFEDWENRYTGRTKPQLRDFLDEDEESDILRIGRSPPQQTPVRQDTQQSGFLPATYPEGYDTIDRRRKKRIRDPGGLHHTEADKMKEVCPSDLALPREKRGEVFLRQVAELQEEEERTTSCLRPYKHGLLYKTRMWAKNEVDNTLENYVAYKKEQDARRKAQFEFEFQSSEDLQYSIESEEEIDGIPFTEEDFPPEFPQHYQDRFSYFDGHLENGLGLREKKCGKAKIGGWATDAMLSPVEEPSDEYVDTMDELQCLVESVSEYLAEKEEEISSPVDSSRFGSSGNLSQTSSQLSETGQDSTGGSEPEESFHSYHSSRFHPSSIRKPFNSAGLTVNGHTPLGEKELRQLAPEAVKKDPPVERSSSKLQRFCDDGPPLPFSPSRVRWLKAINKVRVQLREQKDVDTEEEPVIRIEEEVGGEREEAAGGGRREEAVGGGRREEGGGERRGGERRLWEVEGERRGEERGGCGRWKERGGCRKWKERGGGRREEGRREEVEGERRWEERGGCGRWKERGGGGRREEAVGGGRRREEGRREEAAGGGRREEAAGGGRRLQEVGGGCRRWEEAAGGGRWEEAAGGGRRLQEVEGGRRLQEVGGGCRRWEEAAPLFQSLFSRCFELSSISV